MATPCFATSFLPRGPHARGEPPRARARTRPTLTAPTAAAGAATMTAFRKYHGLGNDFVLIDNRGSAAPLLGPARAAALCDRHTGVGADGVIFLLPASGPGSDFGMRLFNSDGTEPEMCGNGIRCLARFAADLGVCGRTPGAFRVDTRAGVMVPEVRADGSVRVDMGAPVLSARDVPTTLRCTPERGFVDAVAAAGRDWPATAVSMGNPHAVIFVDAADYAAMDAALEQHGPAFENHPAFPAKTNTEFVQTLAPDALRMLVWERGAGRTRACGTGACAVVVAAVLTGRAERGRDVTVTLPGGDLVVQWARGEGGHVFMTGPAELVFSGELAG